MKKILVGIMCCAATCNIVAMEGDNNNASIASRSEEALLTYRKSLDVKAELRKSIIFHLEKIQDLVESRAGSVAHENIKDLYLIAKQVKLLELYATKDVQVGNAFWNLINQFKKDFNDFKIEFEKLEEADKEKTVIDTLTKINAFTHELSNHPKIKNPSEGYKQIS